MYHMLYESLQQSRNLRRTKTYDQQAALTHNFSVLFCVSEEMVATIVSAVLHLLEDNFSHEALMCRFLKNTTLRTTLANQVFSLQI